MPKCIHHPDREAQMMCMKHQLYLCSDCLACRDPKIYCKFRTACTIWFLDKEKKRESRPQPKTLPPGMDDALNINLPV